MLHEQRGAGPGRRRLGPPARPGLSRRARPRAPPPIPRAQPDAAAAVGTRAGTAGGSGKVADRLRGSQLQWRPRRRGRGCATSARGAGRERRRVATLAPARRLSFVLNFALGTQSRAGGAGLDRAGRGESEEEEKEEEVDVCG